jgi:hypothetical protein
MDIDTGRSPSGRATRPADQAPSGLGDTASVPNACANTDRELWRETDGDYYAPSIHVTALGGIGINVGGTVFVRTVRQWHALAAQAIEAQRAETAKQGSVHESAAPKGCAQ